MSKKKLAIIGISGRMGSEIRLLAPEFAFDVTSGVASRLAEAEKAGLQIVGSVKELSPADIDVVIDFSLPDLTSHVIAWCERNNKALVSGVTGISAKHKSEMEAAAKKISILWAPNMSLGVAVLARMLSQLQHLEDFEFQIEELHHKHKKDRPSGTALFLQEKLKEAVSSQVPEPLAIRGGGIFGIHRVWAMGEEETITLEHTAMNRRVFARGALRAARWIFGKAPGLYRIDNVLGT